MQFYLASTVKPLKDSSTKEHCIKHIRTKDNLSTKDNCREFTLHGPKVSFIRRYYPLCFLWIFGDQGTVSCREVFNTVSLAWSESPLKDKTPEIKVSVIDRVDCSFGVWKHNYIHTYY